MNYYKEHGIRPEQIEMPLVMDTMRINKMLHLKQVSHFTGAPIEELRNLNPQYRHDIIPGNDREYILRIPYRYSNAFIENEDSLYVHKAEEYFNPVTIKKIKDGGDGERIVHKVKNGEYLGKIAAKYHVSVAQIKRWNNLSSNNIRVGQRLVVYRGGKGPSAPASSGSTAAKTTATTTAPSSGTTAGKQPAQQTGKPQQSQTQPAASGNYTTYTVKSGDSLYTIAKNYPGVSAQDIMNFNGIGSSIKPGMKIRIPKK